VNRQSTKISKISGIVVAVGMPVLSYRCEERQIVISL